MYYRIEKLRSALSPHRGFRHRRSHDP